VGGGGGVAELNMPSSSKGEGGGRPPFTFIM
jgi:hypothetical protein